MSGGCFADLATAVCFRLCGCVQLAAVLGMTVSYGWSTWMLPNLIANVPASLAFLLLAAALTRRLRDRRFRRRFAGADADSRCGLLATGCVALAVFALIQALSMMSLAWFSDALAERTTPTAWSSFAPAAFGILAGGVLLLVSAPLLVRAFARDLGSQRARG